MCAIWFSIGHDSLSAAAIDSVTHRGPDGRGWKEFESRDGKVVLAHRRLAIVDLKDRAAQPMSEVGGRYWITYNGEVYNFAEIRRDLLAKNHAFTTESDTEVILKSYIEWGPGCLERFNGMFAFVIWDDREKKAFVARDRLGVKPLLIWRESGKMAMASEAKQFMQVQGFKVEADREALKVFNANSYITDELTFFRGVRSLKPGHYLIFENGKESVHEWYNIRDSAREISHPHEQFREILFDAVRSRLVADVPVGALLSGGLDSSSIVCVLDQILKNSTQHQKILTFTSWSEDPEVNEREYSDAVIAKTGFRNQLAQISENDLPQTLDRMIFHQEEPFLSSSVHSEWNLYKTVSEQTDLKVVLDGQGSDELTAGYLYLLPILFRSWIDSGQWAKFIKESYYTFGSEPPMGLGLGQTLRGLARFAVRGTTASRDSYRDFTIALIKNSIEPQLRWQDRSSMAFGIESRHPFLDYRLVEFLLSVSSSDKFDRGFTKAILRDSLKDILPEKVRLRKTKKGFPSPEERLLRSLDANEFKRSAKVGISLLEETLKVNLSSDLTLGSTADIRQHWKFYSLGRWAQIFMDKQEPLGSHA